MPAMNQNAATKALIAMPGFSRLFRRGATYYFRVGVPAEIRPAIGKTEIVKSLRTSDFHEAKQQIAFESANADALFLREREKLKLISKPRRELYALSDAETHRLVFAKSSAWGGLKICSVLKTARFAMRSLRVSRFSVTCSRIRLRRQRIA